MRKPLRALLSLSLIPVLSATMVAPAQAIPADNPVIGPFLPPALQRHTSFAPVKQTFTNPEGGKVHHEIIRSGFSNSSPLFGTERNADLTIEVRNKISSSFKKAYYFAGVQFGCMAGIGNTSLKISTSANTKLTVNGTTSVTGRTEPVTEFIQQSIKTAVDAAVAAATAAAAAGASEGAAAPAVAAAAAATMIDNAVPQAVTTWNLQDTISSTAKAQGGVKANPTVKPLFQQTYQSGRLTTIPLFLLRYSPGINQVRLSGVTLEAHGCIGVAKLRPFVRTIGQTKSGNYVDYTTYKNDYLFIPNKFFRMDT